MIPVKKLPGGDIHTKPKGFAKALSGGRYNYNETKMFSQTSSGNGNNLKKSMQQFNLSSSKQPKQYIISIIMKKDILLLASEPEYAENIYIHITY